MSSLSEAAVVWLLWQSCILDHCAQAACTSVCMITSSTASVPGLAASHCSHCICTPLCVHRKMPCCHAHTKQSLQGLHSTT